MSEHGQPNGAYLDTEGRVDRATGRVTRPCTRCGAAVKSAGTLAGTVQGASTPLVLTIEDALRLPNRTVVRFLDGRIGRMAVWHMSTKTIGVEVRGEAAPREVEATRLRLELDGSCTEIPS
jgi:hypothetical protein